MTILVGITATRTDLPRLQFGALTEVLLDLHVPGASLAHGDCCGGDAAAHEIGMKLGYIVHVLPPVNQRYRAFCVGHHNYDPAPYPVRNRRIASMCTTLVVVPLAPERALPRSGTWQTVRMARRLDKPITLVWPDGTIEQEARDDRPQGDGDRGQRDQAGPVDAGAEAAHRTGHPQ